MPVTFHCPNCRSPLVVDEALLNGPVRCGPCSTVFVASAGQLPAARPVFDDSVERPADASDGAATTSIVLGISSVVLACIPFVAPILAIIGLVMGIRATGSPTASSRAVVGIVLSIIGLLIGGLWALAVLAALMNNNNPMWLDL